MDNIVTVDACETSVPKNANFIKTRVSRRIEPEKFFDAEFTKGYSFIEPWYSQKVYVACDDNGKSAFVVDPERKEIYPSNPNWDVDLDTAPTNKEGFVFLDKKQIITLANKVWNEIISSNEYTYWKWGYWDGEKGVYQKDLYMEFCGFNSKRIIRPDLDDFKLEKSKRKKTTIVWIWMNMDPSNLFKESTNFFKNGNPRFRRVAKEEFEENWSKLKNNLQESQKPVYKTSIY